MSSMLEQAIIDATALREAAIKSAEQAVVEKYSPEIKEAVEKLMEENDFEENKTVDEQIAEADVKGEGYAFVESTELSDLEENQVIDIDVKSLFEEVQKEQLQEEVEIAEELLEEEVEITEDIITGLVEELMNEFVTEGGDKAQHAGETVSDDDKDTDDDIKVKSISKVVIMKDDDEIEDVDATEELDEAMDFDYEPVPEGQTTAFGATRAQQAEQAMLMDVMLAVEEENSKLESKNESLVKTNNKLKESNQKLKETVQNIADKFEEIKLVNSKLFYTNKTLMDDSLNERQKGNLVESINNAQTSEQAKIVYETLKSTVGNANTKKQPESLSEAVGKRSSTSLLLKARKSDEKQVVNEGNIFADRMQILAGIKHQKED
jgi:ribosomal protein S17E